MRKIDMSVRGLTFFRTVLMVCRQNIQCRMHLQQVIQQLSRERSMVILGNEERRLGRIRWVLTEIEFQVENYVKRFLKPGKSTGAETYTNEVVRSMTGEDLN